MTEPIDLLTLRVIVAVADSGSISAGSDRLQLALAATSARISTLEAELGLTVFKRTSRGVEVTPAGHMLVQRARELLSDAERLRQDLNDYRDGIQGHVRLVANASAMLEFIPAQLEKFLRAHPLISVDVEELTSSEVPLALLGGRADLGILDIAHPPQGLSCHDVFVNNLALIVPSGHALAGRGQIAFAETLPETFIGLADGNAIANRLFTAAALLGQTMKTRMQMRSFDAVCRMVAAGLGVSILPVETVAPQLAHLAITAVPLSDTWARRTHRLATCAGAPMLAATQSLMQALLDPAA